MKSKDKVEIMELPKWEREKINITIKYDENHICEEYRYLRLKCIAR